MSNRGGKRENAGRSAGQGKYGESTVAMRIPQSQTATIKSFLEALQRKRGKATDENALAEIEVDEFFTPVISVQPTLLPLFSTKVAAGFPSPADDHVEKRLDISEFMIDHAASTFFVTIKGDSMIDVGLLPGDKVVVDRSKTPSIGDIRALIKANKATSAGDLIAYLNPLIRGWANYYHHVVSSRIFSRVDSAVFRCLWCWALRRHPHRSKRWIRRKYFGIRQNDHWVFQGYSIREDGTVRLNQLEKAARIPIRRHIKIKGQANPYDPAWETYFEQRIAQSMQANLKGKRQLLYLWNRQAGICPVCGQKITKETGWHSHHTVWRSLGGSDGLDNRVLLHPNCHRQVHWQARIV